MPWLVFDRMGPTLGIEISQQGLLRLAAMLTGKETQLPYSLKVDDGCASCCSCRS